MLKIATAMYISDSFYGTMQVCDQSRYETSVARCSRRWRLVRLLVGRAFGLGHPRGKRFLVSPAASFLGRIDAHGRHDHAAGQHSYYEFVTPHIVRTMRYRARPCSIAA